MLSIFKVDPKNALIDRAESKSGGCLREIIIKQIIKKFNSNSLEFILILIVSSCQWVIARYTEIQ